MNNLEKDFIPYDLALKIKMLGFKERVLTYFEDGKLKLYNGINGWDFNTSFMNAVSRPTFSQCFRWFREKHRVDSNIVIGKINFGFKIQYLSNYTNNWYAGYKTYEEAEEECFKELIKIIKDEQQ